ncbi:MAG: class B sortase [Clostridiales bacterium]|nr:class B sortase [Clostridiales bacterium]
MKNKKSRVVSNILILFFVAVIAVSLTYIGLKLYDGQQTIKQYDDVANQMTARGDILYVPVNPNDLSDNPEAYYPPDHDYWWIDDDIWDPDDPSATRDPNATPRPKATTDPNATPKPTKAPVEVPVYEVPKKSVNFTNLQKVNSDVCAWLYLPDSAINYPVVRPSKEYGASYYLSHTYDHKKNIAGSLFVDPIGTPFSGRNSFIHGHRMNNGSMFGGLNQYKKQSYYDKHKIIHLYTPSQNYLMYVFAAFTVEIDGYETTIFFDDDAAFQKYLDNSVKKSDIKATWKPSVNDKIVTLSTCVVQNDTARFMVQGSLRPMP